jgi:hypothetical protein
MTGPNYQSRHLQDKFHSDESTDVGDSTEVLGRGKATTTTIPGQQRTRKTTSIPSRGIRTCDPVFEGLRLRTHTDKHISNAMPRDPNTCYVPLSYISAFISTSDYVINQPHDIAFSLKSRWSVSWSRNSSFLRRRSDLSLCAHKSASGPLSRAISVQSTHCFYTPILLLPPSLCLGPPGVSSHEIFQANFVHYTSPSLKSLLHVTPTSSFLI